MDLQSNRVYSKEGLSDLISNLKVRNEFDKLEKFQQFNDNKDILFHSILMKVKDMNDVEAIQYLLTNLYFFSNQDNLKLDFEKLFLDLLVLLLSNCLIIEFRLVAWFCFLNKNLNVDQIKKLYSKIFLCSFEMKMDSKLYNTIVNHIILINHGLQTPPFIISYPDIISHILLLIASTDGNKSLVASRICQIKGFFDPLTSNKSPNQYYIDHFFISFLINSCFNVKDLNYSSYVSLVSDINFENTSEELSHHIVNKLHQLYLIFFKTPYKTKILHFFLKFIQSFESIIGIGYSFETDCKPFAMMINALLIFSKFCSKIKIENVDKKFLISHQFIDATRKHTRMLCTENELLDNISIDNENLSSIDDFNFSTYIFFITSSLQNMTIIPIINKQKNMQHAIEEINPFIERVREIAEQSSQTFDSLRSLMRRFNPRFYNILNEYETRKLVNKYTEWVLYNPLILIASFEYFTLVTKFIHDLVEEYDNSLCEQDAQPLWKFLPESFVENIAISLTSFSKSKDNNVYIGDVYELIDLNYKIISIYYRTSLINNKHLIARIIFTFVHLMSSNNRRFLSFLISQSENYDFIRSLIYIYNEFTSDNDFDKYSLRLSINEYLRNLKILPSYSYLSNISAIVPTYFRKYINTILDDLSFSLNESLSILKKIREYQLNHDDFDYNSISNQTQNTNSTQEESMQEFARNERSINSLLLLTISGYETLKDLTLNSQEEFLKDEILIRFVPLLNYSIGILCGENSIQFKVKNSQKYNWNPRKLLGLIIDVFLNMRHKIFFQSLASDNTTSIKAYEKALNVMVKNLKRTSDECYQFKILIFSLEEYMNNYKQTDKLLEGAPEEFLDPLTYTIMTDPVKLPSGIIMERTVIVQHLLTKSTDPFTRQDLKESELVPDNDLKQKIKEWVDEKLNKRQ